MTATSSVEILQDLIKNPPQGKKDEAVAAQSLFNEYEGCKQKLSEFDEDKLVSEWNLIEDSFDDAVKVSSKLEYINQLKRCCQVALLNIHALSFFVQNLDREEVLRHISNKHWIKQHEFLTRWAWMTSQKEEIQKGKSFNHPYLCKVGRRERRKTLDREFETFRLFLPGYCKDTATEYWFYEKPCDDPPDFAAVDKQGNKIGIEITEAPLEESGLQAKKREEVVEKLAEDFQGLNCTIKPIASNDQIDWSSLLKNYEELKSWIYHISRLKRYETFLNFDLGIRMSVRKYEPGSNRSILTGYSSSGNRDEHKTSEAICKAIERKVERENKKLEKGITPKIKPCILVIYENTGLMLVDKRLVADLVSENLEARWQNLYEGVWLVMKKCVFKICGAE